jgi:hypothetical protein
MKTFILHIILCICLLGSSNAQDSLNTIQPVIPQKSPAMAIAYTALFPGLGQIYVESYWKAPIAAGAALFFAYQIASYHSTFVEKSNQYDNLITQGLNRLDPRVQLAIREKEFYNNARDINGLWLLGIYGIAAVDAYVGAHMLEFDVSDNLSFTILPDPINQAGRMHISYTF